MTKRIIALFLMLSMLCGSLLSCGEEPNAPADSTDNQQQTSAPADGRLLPLAKNGQALYQIVYPEGCEKRLMTAAYNLKSTLEALTGADFRVSDDYTRDGNPIDSAGEIIIGLCRRTEQQTALSELRQKDFSVVVTEKNILILAWSDAYAVKAVSWLVGQLTAENTVTDSSGVSLLWQGTHLESDGFYRYDRVSVGENDLSDYSIVYAAADGSTYAEDVQAAIANATGYRLPMRADSEPPQATEILVGKTNRAESQAYLTGDGALSLMEYTNTVRNQKIVILGRDHFSQTRAISLFELDLNGSGGTLDGLKSEAVPLIKNVPAAVSGSYRFLQYNILVEYPNWGSGGIIKPELIWRREIVAGLLLEYLPDAAVLCEFFPEWRKQLPPLVEDVYAFVEPDRTSGGSNRTPIIYRKDKFDLVESGYRDIADRENGEDAYKNFRVVTWAVLCDKATGEKVAVFGTHWENASYSVNDRKFQAYAMSGIIADVAAKYENIPIVAMGDFNCRGNSSEFLTLLEEASLTDAFGGQSTQMIDHIALRGCTVKAYGVEQENYAEYASDHNPIWCDVVLN